MTIGQKMIEMMTERGMSQELAERVFALAKKDESSSAMIDRWDDQASDYPEPVIRIAKVSVSIFTADWLEENQPLAWYRPLFELPTE